MRFSCRFATRHNCADLICQLDNLVIVSDLDTTTTDMIEGRQYYSADNSTARLT
jgi:hypothetical protein